MTRSGHMTREIRKQVNQVKLRKGIAHAVIAVLRFALLFGICFVILYPILTKVCASFMTLDDAVDVTVKYIPKHFTWSNYQNAFVSLGMPKTLLVSIGLFALTSVLQTFACTTAAYGFARFHFRGSKVLFLLVIVQLLIPPDTIMLSRFMQFRYFDVFGLIERFTGSSVSLINTAAPVLILAVTCMGLKNGLFIFMLRQYFKGVPPSLEEAAYVDGCGPFKAFVRILLPGAVPMMVTIFLFSFVWLWTDTSTVPVLTNVQVIANMTHMLKTTGGGLAGLRYSLLRNAGMILILLPVIAVYLGAQKFFVQGIETSGLTGQ